MGETLLLQLTEDKSTYIGNNHLGPVVLLHMYVCTCLPSDYRTVTMYALTYLQK